jgi:hypothetical protein
MDSWIPSTAQKRDSPTAGTAAKEFVIRAIEQELAMLTNEYRKVEQDLSTARRTLAGLANMFGVSVGQRLCDAGKVSTPRVKRCTGESAQGTELQRASDPPCSG